MINFSITLLGRLHKSVCENRNVATIATHDFSKVTRFNISNYSSLTKKGISPPSQNTEQQIRSMRYLFRKPHFQLSCSPHLVLSAHCSLLMIFIVGPIGCRPNRGFHLLHLLHLHHPAVSRLSINSHIQAISALPPTYHTSPERGHYQGSSGDDKDKDKDTHKDKYEDKDKDRRKSSCIYKFRYSVQQ